jgi:hypothetical protein
MADSYSYYPHLCHNELEDQRFMPVIKIYIAVLLALLISTPELFAAQETGSVAASPLTAGKGTIFTLWPLVDYRESPGEGFSNLSLLGPLIKFQQKGEDRDTALRPFFYRKERVKEGTSATYFLYPAAFQESTPDNDTYEVMRLFQTSHFRKTDEEKHNDTSMLFPFYIAGESPTRGRYRAVLPFYGDVYDRFWRDEYHFLMFPLYGSTVNHGTTTKHYLYPFFSTTRGEKETGFEFFPFYGESQKEGVYSKKFVLWPFYTSGQSGLNTDNPVERRFLFPLYAATDSPKKTSRSYLWPFFGYTDDRGRKLKEVDYFWPFISTLRGENRNSNTFLPIYSRENYPDGEKVWYAWPFFRHEEIRSDIFNQDLDRVLFFLYRDTRESWPKDGAQRRRTALWPLFLYNSSPRGVSSISLPAPVESVFDKEGIEENWAPLWRLYQRRWDEDGNSASSLLWNLFWEERRGQDLAYELFPLVSYRRTKEDSDLKLLKGLISLKRSGEGKELNLLWIPYGLKWGGM